MYDFSYIRYERAEDISMNIINEIEYELVDNLFYFVFKNHTTKYSDVKLNEHAYHFLQRSVKNLTDLGVEGFEEKVDDDAKERLLFNILFTSDNPTFDNVYKMRVILEQLKTLTMGLFRKCLLPSTLREDVEKYIFMEKNTKMYMMVNVIENIKISEHIYIHRLPSAFIKRLKDKLENPDKDNIPSNFSKKLQRIQNPSKKDKDALFLSKKMHEFAISVIKPDYVVSNPLEVMKIVFKVLEDENIVTLVSTGFKDFNNYEVIKIIRENFRDSDEMSRKTCESPEYIFKVNKIPEFSFKSRKTRKSLIKKSKRKSIRKTSRKSIRKTSRKSRTSKRKSLKL